MDIREHVVALNTTRLRVWEEAQAHLDECQRRHPADEMSGEEREKWERLNARMDEIDAEVRSFVDRETRERESAVSREAFERQYGTAGAERLVRDEMEEVRAWMRGEVTRSEDFEAGRRNTLAVNLFGAEREARAIRLGADPREVRALLWDTGSSGSLVPTVLSRTLYQYLEATIAAFRMPTTKLTTSGGLPLEFPLVATHGVATQVISQGTAIGGTDPVFGKMHLDAFKYGQLVQVGNEVIQDSAIDIIDFVAGNVGRAVGRLIDAALIAGSGSGQPQGIMTARIVGAAGTVATGGSLITPTYENLVDTVYSVNDAYRQMNCAWLMRDATAGQIRKLRDGAGGTVGAVLWNPSLTSGIQFGQPDRLLDYPVYIDPNVASLASNARIIAFGDFSAYYVRQVGNFVFERSDDYAFNVDEVTFRGKWRCDGDYIDLTAVNLLKQSV